MNISHIAPPDVQPELPWPAIQATSQSRAREARKVRPPPLSATGAEIADGFQTQGHLGCDMGREFRYQDC